MHRITSSNPNPSPISNLNLLWLKTSSIHTTEVSWPFLQLMQLYSSALSLDPRFVLLSFCFFLYVCSALLCPFLQSSNLLLTFCTIPFCSVNERALGLATLGSHCPSYCSSALGWIAQVPFIAFLKQLPTSVNSFFLWSCSPKDLTSQFVWLGFVLLKVLAFIVGFKRF